LDTSANSQASNNIKDDEVSLKESILKLQEWWAFLLSKWVIILIAGIIGGIAGYTYAHFTPPTYKAVLSFALEDDKSGEFTTAGLASQFGFDVGGGGGAFSGDNLLELMKSRSMVEKALLTPVNINGKEQTLVEYYISYNKYRQTWQDKPQLRNIQFLPGEPRASFSLQQDSLLGTFYNTIIKDNLMVDKSDKKLSIINVSVTSENELFSKYFAEIVAKTVSDFYIDTKTKKSTQNVTILQRQSDSVRLELNSAINGVALSTDETPNANPGRQILHAPSQHKQIDVQVNQAILTELVKNLELSKMSLRRETPLIQVIDKPILPLDKVKLSKSKCLVLGGVICMLITVLLLLLKETLRNILNS
jgi:hypothetical protein